MKGWHFAIPSCDDGFGLGDPERVQMVRLDWTPIPLEVELEAPLLTLRKTTRDNGLLQIPYRVKGFGEVHIPLTQLMQRDVPYRLPIELARGQLNQTRHCMADALLHGYDVKSTHLDRLRLATQAFGKAVRSDSEQVGDPLAQEALQSALWIAEELVHDQCRQILETGNEHLLRPTRLGCRVDEGVLGADATEQFRSVFGAAYVGKRWIDIEPQQCESDWSGFDSLVDWSIHQELGLTVGPLIDFSNGMPSWLHSWAGDHESLLTLLIDRIESTMGRYRDRVSRWLVVQGVNSADVMGLSESKMLWLTKRLIEAARSMDPGGDLLVGIDQPWGDYVARSRRVYCPATFIDTLLRAQTTMTGISLELAMGYADGGSFVHTLDSMAQLLGHFSEFGLPLDVVLSIGSSKPSFSAGCWHGEFSEASQQDWAAKATTLCLAHGTVRQVLWGAWRDRPGMRFESSGLLDSAGRPKPALKALCEVRETFLH